MFVRVKSTPNSPRRSVQICQSKRIGKKVSQTIVRHVGIAMDDNEEKELVRLANVIRAKLEADHSETLPLFSPEQIAGQPKRIGPRPGHKGKPIDEVLLRDCVEQARVVEGIHEVFGALFDELGFNKILQGQNADILKSVVLARVANPQSKHRTAALLEEDFAIKLPLDRIYRMMDALHDKLDHVQHIVHAATTSLFDEKLDVCFFDVTTLYFESIDEDDLRGFGYSKDQKFHQVQVVLALATTEHGLPVGYRLFHGATAEVTTLLECVQSWRTRFRLGHVVFVADRGMMSQKNLAALEAAKCQYIVGASLRKLSALWKRKVLDEQGYRLTAVESDAVWVKQFELKPGQRLITSYSAKRAYKDAKDREKLLEKLATRLGKERKGKLKKLISNRGYLKYTTYEGKAVASINDDKVKSDAQWDGMYGIITNADSKLDALEILARYRRLWTVEEAFRISKHDLKMRPIFHYKSARIEAHVAICFLAYALLRHAQHRVRLRKVNISVDVLRNELLRVQASVLRDQRFKGVYRLPSNMSQLARDIYGAFDLKRSLTPTALT